MPGLLYLLAVCNLVIGTGAFVLGGILTPLASSLDVSVAAAGQAMTAYALATAVLAPLALVFTGRWPRKRVLCVSLAVFAAGNALCALAGSLGVLLAGRVLMGLGAVFTAVAAGIAVANWTARESRFWVRCPPGCRRCAGSPFPSNFCPPWWPARRVWPWCCLPAAC